MTSLHGAFMNGCAGGRGNGAVPGAFSDGAFSDAHYPAMSCLKCDAATNQLGLSDPDTSNHCYFDDICHKTGERATGRNWRNEPR